MLYKEQCFQCKIFSAAGYISICYIFCDGHMCIILLILMICVLNNFSNSFCVHCVWSGVTVLLQYWIWFRDHFDNHHICTIAAPTTTHQYVWGKSNFFLDFVLLEEKIKDFLSFDIADLNIKYLWGVSTVFYHVYVKSAFPIITSCVINQTVILT